MINVATVEEKRPIWKGGREVVSIRVSSPSGSVEAYKNEDGICTFLPNLHTFLVQLLSPGGIHIEDGSGRGAETGLVRSGASGSIIGLGRHNGKSESLSGTQVVDDRIIDIL